MNITLVETLRPNQHRVRVDGRGFIATRINPAKPFVVTADGSGAAAVGCPASREVRLAVTAFLKEI